MRSKVIQFLLGLSVCASLALAQGPRGPLGPGGGRGFGPMSAFEHGQVVTGAPFTATLEETVTQKLADGNTITRTTTSQFARDSQGRTWLQTTTNGLGPWASASGKKTTLTFINDPVAGTGYTLDQSAMTATQRTLRTRANGAPEGMSRRQEFSESSAVKTSLGTQMMAPLPNLLQGTQITRTIPANTIGNAQAIVSTTTRWYSPDLKMVVMQTTTDPRMGTRTFQITNIQTGEPASTLFQVPSGYSVTARPGRAAMRLSQQ